MISIANEIAKLHELKEKGVITQQEFESQKKKLLREEIVDDYDEGKIFFDDRGVRVTTTTFQIPGNKTFAMSGVTAVKPATFTPPKLPPLLIMLITGFVSYTNIGKNDNGVIVFGVLSLFCLLWILMQKKKYYVVLSTASGETQALYDYDPAWIDQVIAALNECIVYRK